MSNYPYAPPPPAPSAASPSPYPPYSQGPGYSHPAPRGGHAGATSGGRSHGHHHQGPGRSEYSSSYYQQDYSSPSGGPYNPPQPASYWQGAPSSGHGHSNGSSMPPSYPPSYAPQGFPQPSQPYQPPYPSQPSRPPYGGVPYGQAPSEFAQPPQQWGDHGQAYPSYSSRGGRGGYPSDRSGPLRNPYPPAHHQPAPMQSPYGYSPPTASAFPGPPQPHYGSTNRGHGRGGHAHSSRGAHGMSNDRGEKFRHRDQKSHPPLNYQKSDAASGKKKKRKTNTLGLTPDDDDSDKGEGVDDEKRLAELFGSDGPGIPDGDLEKWLAERRANFPTKARVAQKEAELHSQLANHASNGKEAAAVQVDPVEKEADRLRKRLAKLDRKIEKRKRAPNDEGDDMRSESSDEESEDEKPESMPTDKSATGFLPPPPITRADPSNHCKYYSTGGICGKKGKCRFVHDPAVREAALSERTRNGGQMTLKQRLLLNDKDQDDMEVIKTIVDMRSNGRLHNPQTPLSFSQPDVQIKDEKPVVPMISSLPTTGGEANLPPNPFAHLKNRKPPMPMKKHNDWAPTGQHQGWNPPGFGGAGMPPK
ncbi:hypothetical protein F5Y02DRAFT_186840 [Annulohypoxylon stygium]|nr:hypothetical protein F5Y02DRAFT_186840 [Annulohypoxylon stygium]